MRENALLACLPASCLPTSMSACLLSFCIRLTVFFSAPLLSLYLPSAVQSPCLSTCLCLSAYCLVLCICLSTCLPVYLHFLLSPPVCFSVPVPISTPPFLHACLPVSPHPSLPASLPHSLSLSLPAHLHPSLPALLPACRPSPLCTRELYNAVSCRGRAFSVRLNDNNTLNELT